MTRPRRPRWPTITYCAACDRTEAAHKIRSDRRSRGGTDDGACPGFQPGRVEERPPADELHRRLNQVLELPSTPPPGEIPAGIDPAAYTAGWDALHTHAVLLASGEVP